MAEAGRARVSPWPCLLYTSMALVEAYEATDGQNTDDLLALAEVYESMLALQARVEALEGGEQVNG